MADDSNPDRAKVSDRGELSDWGGTRKYRSYFSNPLVCSHVSHFVRNDIAGTIGPVPEGLLSEVINLNKENIRPLSFPLRLPFSTRRQAIEIAQREGLSLNQFISLAVAEKITRLERTSWPEQISGNSPHALMARKD